MTAAARMQKSRELRKAGKIPVLVPVDEPAIEDVLVAHGFLDPALADQKESISAALVRLLTVLRATSCPNGKP